MNTPPSPEQASAANTVAEPGVEDSEAVEPSPAERRAQRRANQTTFNLILALVASLGVVLLLVVVVVRPEPEPRTVDFREVGTSAAASVDLPIVVPELPPEWAANRAELVTDAADGVARWEIGFLTPGGQYIGLVQGFEANASWLSGQVLGARSTTSVSIGDLSWDLYDRRDVDDPGNVEFALATEAEGSIVVLGGTATDAEFEQLAAAVAEEMR